MLLATINSSIILIALDIFRRIHLDPLTPANTNYPLRTTACLLVGWASVLSLDRAKPALARVPFTPPFRHNGMVTRSVEGLDCFESTGTTHDCRIWYSRALVH